MTSRKEKMESLLEGIADDDIIKAQIKLDTQCKKHGIKTWEIKALKGNWLELGLLMLGLKINISQPKPAGRHARPSEDILKIGNFFSICDDFDNLDEIEKGKKPKRMKKKEKLSLTAKHLKVESVSKKLNGSISDPDEVVRGVLSNYPKIRAQYEIERNEKEEYPDFP